MENLLQGDSQYIGLIMTNKVIKNIKSLQEKCNDSSLEEGLLILDELEEVLKDEQGIGLAANQIGIQKRVCIVRVPKKINGETFTIGHNFINPKIIERSEPIIFENEGCLSFPGTFIKTVRYNKIKVVDLLSPEGREFEELEAVCVQHEIDHTLGKTMYESTPKAIGPNNQCPCGSNKKFKKCCLVELRNKKLL